MTTLPSPPITLFADELRELAYSLSARQYCTQTSERDEREIQRHSKTAEFLAEIAETLGVETSPPRPREFAYNRLRLAQDPELVKQVEEMGISVSYFIDYLGSERFRRHTGIENGKALAEIIRAFDMDLGRSLPRQKPRGWSME